MYKKLYQGKVAGADVGIAMNRWEYVLYVGNNQYYYSKMEHLMEALLGILVKKELMTNKKEYTELKELLRDIKDMTSRVSKEIQEAIRI